MVTVVVCPAIHVVGEMEEMDAPAAQGSCAWQKAEESRNKNVAARRSGPGIAPPFDPRACAWVRSFRRVGCELGRKNGSEQLYPTGAKRITKESFSLVT